MKAIPMRRELRLAVTPRELWPLISNTNRFNRVLGLPAMSVAGRAPEFGKKVTARLFGLKLSWLERPFEWVEGRYFNAVREFDSGPIARFEGGMEILPKDGGCELKINSDFTPRNALGDFLIRYVTGRKAIADAEGLMRRYEASIKSQSREEFSFRRASSPPEEAALARRAQALMESPGCRAAAERLVRFLSEGFDDELSRMRPFELADRWSLDRIETLKAFFHAVKAGLVDMGWEVLCPNCSSPKEILASLKSVRETAHCPGCDVAYGVDFSECVELRFTVSPSVRKVETAVYCVGNPSQAAFALAQLLVKPGERRDVELELAQESYRLVDMGAKTSVKLRPFPDAPERLELDLSALKDGEELRFRPGKIEIDLAGAAGRTALVRLEREAWKEKGAKASIVTTLQEFRDLFSSEVLAEGVEIGVKTLAILFSDLKGSTALYEKIGDATAYAVVRDHFAYMFKIISRHDGAVVKTIGDAVMAVFSSPDKALQAALEIQERIGELDAALSPKPPVVIKLGVHQGPAIAINAGGVLDYFGTTVNVAARVQNESQGGDIVLTEAMVLDPLVLRLLSGAALSPFEMRLKGLSEVFRLSRLTPRRRAAGSSPAGA